MIKDKEINIKSQVNEPEKEVTNHRIIKSKEITKLKGKDAKMKPNKEDEAKPKEVDLESVLSDFKIFGKYHLKFMILVGTLAFLSACHSMNYIFAAESVGHICKHNSCNALELSKLGSNSSIDYKCHKYELIDVNGTCSEENFDVSHATDCEEWVYDKPVSFSAEFNVGCDDWKRTLVGTMHSAGYMLGLFLVGPASDKFGRKNLIIFTSLACTVIGLVKSMAYTYWMYVVLETMEPLLGDCYSATFTMSIESVTKENRPLMIVILNIFTACGGLAMGLVAWLTPNWRMFLVILYSPGFLFIMYIFWMDESIRWLLNKGKKNEVDTILRQAAKTNNIIIEESRLAKLKCEESNANSSLMTLVKMTFSSKKLFLRLLCCVCMWFTALFNIYSLMINSVSLKGNKYLNFSLTVFTGIPASILLLLLLVKCKRKKPLLFSFLLTGAFCSAHAVIPSDYAWLSVTVYVCAKLASTIAMRIVYIYTSELFPTYTRNTMHALCSALGRTAAIIAPQTPLLIEYWPGLPSLIMGILSLLTAAVVTLMPDTSDEVLPDTVRQAEAVGKKEKEFKVNVCSRL